MAGVARELAAIGIDAGSTTCKIVGISRDGEILSWKLEPAQPRIEDQVSALLAAVRAEHGAGDRVVPLVATGYGRKLIREADRCVTEISCHAIGVFRATGSTGTLVDIGGQDTKVITIGKQGKAIDFLMNDKCAAGTGRFLEHSASRLGVPIDELGDRALAADRAETISSTCTVFAESEIISLLARGVALEPILRGLHASLVSRVVAMIHSVGLVPPLLLSGGVARNRAVRELMAAAVGHPVKVPPHPQLMGAFGAALDAGTRAPLAAR